MKKNILFYLCISIALFAFQSSEGNEKSFNDLIIDSENLNKKLPKGLDEHGIITLIKVWPRQPLDMEFYYNVNTNSLYNQAADELGVTVEELRRMIKEKIIDIDEIILKEIKNLAKNEKKKMCSPSGQVLHKAIIQGVKIHRIYFTEESRYITTNIFDNTMCD